MSIHIYENGTVGAQDGTEVQFLHFDGGAMAAGESKTVSKSFYIRTDGEEIEHIEISIGAINDDGTAIYKDKSYYSENKMCIRDSKGTFLNHVEMEILQKKMQEQNGKTCAIVIG